MMNWLDSHCHINDEAFKDDLDEVLARMVENDVLEAMIISSHVEDFEYALRIDSDQIAFKRSLGVYPGDVNETDEKTFERFKEFFADERCQAIGEIGLDYHWDKENKERQKGFFLSQIEIARKLDKPIIVHSRDAIQDTYDILKDAGVRGVMHCYSDSPEMAREFVKLGFYISIAGPVTWKNARVPLEVVKAVPLERLLIETDCPYLTPVPKRGQRNEPSYVVYTGKKIAEHLGIDEEAFKKRINENYHELFRL